VIGSSRRILLKACARRREGAALSARRWCVIGEREAKSFVCSNKIVRECDTKLFVVADKAVVRYPREGNVNEGKRET
jgi:hypothetical protein